MKELIIKKGDKQITVADKEDVMDALDNKSDNTHGHGNLQNDGRVGTSNNANKNVVTDGNGNITTEAKPTIPTKTSQLTNDSNFTTATGHNHDSTYIKQTGGVSQNSNGNIIIPSASNTSAVDGTGKIPFAGHLVSSTYSIEDFTTKLKSFIGGLKDKDNRWWNVISVRQTNGGGSEAENNGLIFKSILDTNSNLLWNKERNGTWGTERTILDSSNYSNYANKTTVDTALSSTSTNPVQNKVINTALGNKVDKVSGKGLSTNDFTNDLKTKLDGIATGANKITVDSALSSTSTNPVQNKVINTALGGKANSSHTHTKSNLIHYDGGGTSGTAGYVKLLQIKVNDTYANVPISFDIYQRGSSEPSHCALMFTSGNTVDPAIGSFTYTGNQRNIYIYKETTSTWSVIVQKSENYDTIHINNVDTGHSYMDAKVTFTSLNTHVTTLPTSNITQASFIGFTSAEKTKLNGIATGATKVSVDSALSSTSTNPVQNKVINTALGNKVDKVSGKGLSTNDFTNDLKTKLDGIATGANKITVDSALSSTSTNPVQNKVINTALGNKADKSSYVTCTVTYTDGSTGTINFVTR